MNMTNKRGLVDLVGFGAVALMLSLPASADELSAANPLNASSRMEETTVRTDADAGRAASSAIPRKGREERSLRVSYGDLNLHSQAGVDTLYRRLESAARTVCSPREQSREFAKQRNWQNCYDNAVDGAVAAIGNPELRDVHFARTGRREDMPDNIANR